MQLEGFDWDNGLGRAINWKSAVLSHITADTCEDTYLRSNRDLTQSDWD